MLKCVETIGAHGLEPPYTDLLAWLEGEAEKPDVSQRVTFNPVMLAHPLDEERFQLPLANDVFRRLQVVIVLSDLSLRVRTARHNILFFRFELLFAD